MNLQPSDQPGGEVEAAPRRIGLTGCVKEKASGIHAARDLYLSPLFEGRRAFVEHSCDEWWILSALHGLVQPGDSLEPYDVTLNDVSASVRRSWSLDVLASINDRINPSAGDIFELHAGANYRLFGLAKGLRERGCHIVNPTEGLSLGRQLRFYGSAQWR